MGRGDVLVDPLVAGSFVRPALLLRGLQLRRSAHRQLFEAFGASRSRIPAGQLVVLSYED